MNEEAVPRTTREYVAEAMGKAAALGTAGAMRLMATTLRSNAELQVAQARSLEDLATAIEEGREEIPAAPVRLMVVPEQPVAEEDVPDLVDTLTTDAGGGFVRAIDGGPVDPGMREWLDLFDDRIYGSDHFLDAVNEAAARELPLTEDTARLVAARARELHEATTRGSGE